MVHYHKLWFQWLFWVAYRFALVPTCSRSKREQNHLVYSHLLDWLHWKVHYSLIVHIVISMKHRWLSSWCPNLDGLLPFFQSFVKSCFKSVMSPLCLVCWVSFVKLFQFSVELFESSFSHFSVKFSFNKCVKGFVFYQICKIMTPLPNE